MVLFGVPAGAVLLEKEIVWFAKKQPVYREAAWKQLSFQLLQRIGVNSDIVNIKSACYVITLLLGSATSNCCLVGGLFSIICSVIM